MTVVYIHPKANVDRAAQHICDVAQKLDSLSPDAPNFVLGDFNQCKLKKCLPTYHQYVTCPTRMDRTIDLYYGSVPNAYRSIAKPPIGDADHNTVHLVPIYKSLLKRAKCVERQVKVWTEDSTARLQGCFDVFRNSCSSLGEHTDVVTSYVSFCVDTVIPVKKYKVFPNNKQWVSKQLKHALNEKKRVYFRGDLAERKGIQRTVKSEIRKARESYKHKIEMKFQTGDMRAVWDGIKIMSDMQQHGQPSNRLSPLGGKADGAFAEEMNSFYSRFDTHDFHSAINGIDSSTKTDGKLEIEEKDVLRIFQRTNVRKIPGPDGISGHVLKTCASQLSGIFRSIFQASLSLHKNPILWKTSTVVPVPKKAHPVIPNDFRHIALTSHVMKSFEKIIKLLL